MGDKLFRDPLYNYINIDRKDKKWLLDLIDCPEFQRLRRIHQLGVSHFTYPGAEHTRFAHSLGVLYLMSKAYNHLYRTIDGTNRQHVTSAEPALLAVALLHDIGHGPFSHLFESCMDIDHEYWSKRIISDTSAGINQKLSAIDSTLPDAICDLIEGTKPSLPRWQKSLISSQLDMDRMDYLRRDSLFSGAGYGHFDWSRLITTIELHNTTTDNSFDLVWPSKASMAIEEYIFARYYMYQNVYLHKTTRGFEVLLQAMWKRARSLIDEGESPELVPTIKKVWLTKPDDISVRDYLAVEEHRVMYQIQLWSKSPDKILGDLATRFINRDGFAMIDPPPASDPLTEDRTIWEDKVSDILKKNDYDPAYYCLKDELQSKYLTPYRPEPEKGQQDLTNAIFIKNDNDEILEVSDHLPRLKAVIEMGMPSSKFRYYVPKDVRSSIQNIT